MASSTGRGTRSYERPARFSPGQLAQGSIDAAALESRLKELALNLWWTWHPEVIELFRDLDPIAWRKANHNPITLLTGLGPDELARRVAELSLESRINFHYRRLQEYLADDDTWCATHAGSLRVAPVAYLSAEFGIHESLPLYSGGLGILAGDHMKSASDLGVPAVGVGLFYANGYFQQRLDETGWQQEDYGTTDIDALPLLRAASPDGSALTVQVQCAGEILHAGVWIAHLGRTRLLLLDSNVPVNPGHLRELTGRLYGGDQVTRIRQEILLGIGGLRALRALGIRPLLLHLNEGHSAFAILERTREQMEEERVGFHEAFRETAIQTIFTTHTPVEAGHDRFAFDLMEQQLGWLRTQLGLEAGGFMALGRSDPGNSLEPFCMTVLGLRGSRRRNAVSSLHGHVSRRMWSRVWPGRPEEEVPIGHITNGVHVRSWLAPSMARIYDKHLPADWFFRQSDPAMWQAIEGIDDGELWEAHLHLRRRLVDFVRRRTGSPSVLAPGALTIGFARRFATYKRALLILSEPERLANLCNDPAQPVQFVLAGKAHPHDDEGKRLLRQVAQWSRDPRFVGRVAFVEDYDINVARHLAQGVDVWLNTPLRPQEACGTSGQKVLLNGGLNLSVLDGWWAEAYDGENGFAVGTRATHADPSIQWQRDATALYRALESEVIPLFFDLDATGLPRRWIRRMKHSITSLAWRYNADRMVADYVRACYLPAAGTRTHDTTSAQS